MKRIPLLQLLSAMHPRIEKKELLAKIMCGEVLVNGERIRDPKALVREDVGPTIQAPGRFVSRGGEKLAHALPAFKIDVGGKTLIDAGASTGGFTDCLLQQGAAKVYAVDVGYCQLDYKLRRDVRVVVMEKTNIIACTSDMFSPRPDMAVMDLSFRSLRGAARHCLSLTREKRVIALIKPQFEWQDPDENFEGVVHDPDARARILDRLVEDLGRERVFVADCAASPILGRKGNREYLFLLQESEGMTAAQWRSKIASFDKKD
jgi:23S rRNA (cytidine1920-2'-O)/16S rRNA (cytidine1409-2'-O)-methyltransferase